MPTVWKPEESFGGLAILVGLKFTKMVKSSLAEQGLPELSFSRIGILNSLTRGKLSQVELCKIMNQKPPSMTQILNRMEQEQLVKWKKNPLDGREKIWEVTSKGREKLNKTKKLLRDLGSKLDQFFEQNGIKSSMVVDSKELLRTINASFFEAR